jgi:pimeloyl-ACP methyl ester carboxylesterase
MTSHVTSADDTVIAYDQMGSGPPVVVAGGIFCDRQTTQALAEHLADACTVVNFDRRGRGESGDTPPYAVEREVEDIAALIAAVGGSAALYGHSSGAGLALHAAARGLPVTRLVLHEPPWGPDDDESTGAARRLAADVGAALAEGRPGDAIARFMADSGLPPEMVGEMSRDPKMLAVAPTMPYDLQVMRDDAGGTIPEDLARTVTVPTLVLAGGASPDFFRDTAERLVELLPDAELAVLEGQDHGAAPEVVAPLVTKFVAG